MTPQRRTLLEFLFALCCVFAGLALPSPGLGPLYVRAHAALLDGVVGGLQLESGVSLSVQATSEELEQHPWKATLVIQPPAPARPVLVPTDLRGLMFLPTAAFMALALATPLASFKRNLRILALGLPALECLLLVLNTVPMLSFLGGTGPVGAFQLGVGTHALLQVVYRALVAPPGMMFAVPLFIWWVLVVKAGGFQPRTQRSTAASV